MRLKMALLLILAVVIALSIWFLSASNSKPREDFLDQARQAMRAGQLSVARKAAAQALAANPKSSQTLLVAAEIEMRQENWEPALVLLNQIPPSVGSDYATAQFTCGEIHRNLGQLSLAEKSYQNALAAAPGRPDIEARLALLKRMTGRIRAAEQHLQSLLSQQQISPEQLAWLAAPDRNVSADAFLRKCNESTPDDPLPMFGLGTIALNQGKLAEAENWYQKGLALQPDPDPEASAALGRCLLEQGETKSIQAWARNLTPEQRQQPDVNFVLGVLNEHASQLEDAVSHYARCLDLVPNHQAALNHLGTLLNRLGQTRDAANIIEVVQLVSQLNGIMASIQPRTPSPEAAFQAAGILSKLGRFDEAMIWAALAGAPLPRPTSEEIQLVQTVQQSIRSLAARPIENKTPAMPLASMNAERNTGTAFHFVDEARDVGIEFHYFESPDPKTEGRRMFEFTGGGVGVLDYDIDSWPDLYFTQGTKWPPDPAATQYRDALYRQVDQHFVRIDELAGVDEISFSQGVSIGDLNNDGFPDVYVANFGPNQCFMNNGDGTFSKCLDAELNAQSQWTTSCLVADLNGDNTPDLFDVNYVHGPGVETSICQTAAGPRVCTPLAFQATVDRLLISNTDGEFKEATQEFALDKPGNGLGVIAVNLDQDTDLELFIANDLMENFLWDRKVHHGKPAFEDIALLHGWAFGSEGTVQASMGVAAADFNGDDKVDLFVTNYFNESNALYISEEAGLTQDRASAFGLRAPSLPMLGFGTQAIDADLDGDWDLVVANGDLDDFTHENRKFAMPPQLFENLNSQQFQEALPTTDNSYFSKTYRGRGLAKLDWNRDGRCDFAVSHLEAPAALVTNRTDALGQAISLRLVGTTSSRDAIGASVTLTTGTHHQQQQLTAGDGYQSSNERRLLFAVPVLDTFELRIKWPSGMEDIWSNLDTHNNWIAIEGKGVYSAATQ